MLLYFGGTFILHSQLLRSEKQFFNNEIQDSLSSSQDICVLQQSTGAPDGSSSESLGTKVRAPESHRKKQMAGADPEQSHYRELGAGGDADTGSVPNLTEKTWKWLPSGAVWWWEVRRGGGLRPGRLRLWLAHRRCLLWCPCLPSILRLGRKNHTSLWPSDDLATQTGWPLSKWHFQIMECSIEAGSYLCR